MSKLLDLLQRLDAVLEGQISLGVAQHEELERLYRAWLVDRIDAAGIKIYVINERGRALLGKDLPCGKYRAK